MISWEGSAQAHVSAASLVKWLSHSTKHVDVAVTPYSKPETQAHAVESETLSSSESVQWGWHSGLPATLITSSVITSH